MTTCHPIKRAWENMKIRCLSPSHKYFKDYGGRGIGICSRWLTYENFLSDMQPWPGPGYTLERIDNSKGYFKENCKWATPTEQRNNQRPRSNPSGLTGVRWNKHNVQWEAYTKKPQTILYSGKDFFLACCARKSWEAQNVIGQ